MTGYLDGRDMPTFLRPGPDRGQCAGICARLEFIPS